MKQIIATTKLTRNPYNKVSHYNLTYSVNTLLNYFPIYDIYDIISLLSVFYEKT